MNLIKNYPKINAIVYSFVFVWMLYMTIKRTPYFWIFAIIFGLLLLYWIWRAWGRR